MTVVTATTSQPSMNDLRIPASPLPRIVIVGGGFAGLKLMIELKNKPFQLVLLDINNYHQFQPLFYQVATAGLEPSSISFPFRKILQKSFNSHFRQAEVTHVDTENKVVTTNLGKLGYDYLVIATGANTNYFGNDNIEKYGHSLKSLADALMIRNQLLTNFEKAITIDTAEEKEALFNIVIVGGGPTGVEVAGTFAEMKKRILPKDYPGEDFSKMNVFLIEAADRLLNGFHKKSSARALKYLEKLGVKTLLNTFVDDYNGSEVRTSNGMKISSNNLLWTAGIRGNTFPAGANAFESGNRYLVDSFNAIPGNPFIYALGDVACMKADPRFPSGHPQLAQVAIQQAKTLASNLLALQKGRKTCPFRYKDLGIMATIGRNLAVVELPWFRFYGFFAWLVWMFVHLMAILGVRNKLMIFINWFYHYFTFDQSLRLIIQPKRINN